MKPRRACCSILCADQSLRAIYPIPYTGATNTTFTRAGGSIAEYAAGMAYAEAQKWLKIDSSGTRITLLADGAE